MRASRGEEDPRFDYLTTSHLSSTSDTTNPYASPLLAEDVGRLPELIMVGECDSCGMRAISTALDSSVTECQRKRSATKGALQGFSLTLASSIPRGPVRHAAGAVQ